MNNASSPTTSETDWARIDANARQLAQWLQNYLEEQWDRQIEADFASGKLDHLVAKAEAEFEAGECREM